MPGEPPLLPPNPTFSQTRLVLSELRGLAMAEQSEQLKAQSGLYPFYSGLRKTVEEKIAQGKATLDEEIQLGGCLLRLNQPAKAMAVLEAAWKKAPADFPSKHLLLANLATAYGVNDLFIDRAVDTQRDAIKAWPGPEKDFKKWEAAFRAEVVFLKLLQEKQLKGNSRERPEDAPPAVFGNFSNEWKKSTFQPGKTSIAFYERFPPDSMEICSLFLTWLPLDNQLYWLYGELLNATGDKIAAGKVLDELINARQMSNSPALFEHSKILRRQSAEGPLEKDAPRPEKKGEDSPSKEAEKPRNLLGGDLRFLVVGLIAGIFTCFILQKQFKQWLGK